MSDTWQDILDKHKAKLTQLEQEVRVAQGALDHLKKGAEPKKRELEKAKKDLDQAYKDEKAAKAGTDKKKASTAEASRVALVKLVTKLDKEVETLKAGYEKENTALKVAQRKVEEEKAQIATYEAKEKNRLQSQMKDVEAYEGAEAAYFADIKKIHLGAGDTVKKTELQLAPLEKESKRLADEIARVVDDTQKPELMDQFKQLQAEMTKLKNQKDAIDLKKRILEERLESYKTAKAELQKELGTGSISKEKYERLKKRAQQLLKG